MHDYMNMKKNRCVKGVFQFLLLHPGFNIKQTENKCSFMNMWLCAYVELCMVDCIPMCV